MFQGSIVALVTPMQPDGSIDKKALAHLIEWHIAAKTDGLVIAGTTGEGSTLGDDEHEQVLQSAIKQVAGRIPVIAGTGSNCTEHTIQLTKNAQKAGADAALIVTPYYNKPPQRGLYNHYQSIAEHTHFPIILYNVPGRTACDLLPKTIAELAQIKQIIGIKEATGKVERADEIRKLCGKDFPIYCGADEINLALMIKAGAKGAISVTANIAPAKMQQFCQAALAGELALAEKLHHELMPLHRNLFLESNPIPIKWALAELGLIPPGIRLPLSPFDPSHHAELKAAMKAAGVM